MPHSIVDDAPTDSILTAYDRDHIATYLRLLDAATSHTAWEESARILLGIDASVEPNRASRCYESHLARARWVAIQGYRHILDGSSRYSSRARRGGAMQRTPHISPGQRVEIKSVGDRVIVTVAGGTREYSDMSAAAAYVNALLCGLPVPTEPVTSGGSGEEVPNASTTTDPAQPR